MEKLPPELLFKIFLCLPPADRLRCSLTCRRWAEAMSSSQLLDDVWLDIAGREMKAAYSVLAQSRRQYKKLLLYGADLSEFNSGFWRNIGRNLRVLELEECTWSTRAFYSVLQHCSRIESLKIVNAVRGVSIDDFVLPEDLCREELRDSLSQLRHLHLRIKLTAEILDILLELMSNITSIFLSSWFDEDSDFLERLPSILKKNRSSRTGADFSLVGSEEVIEFLEITSGSLEELRITDRQLSKRFSDAILNCTKLRRVALREIDALLLERVVSNSPDLETLEVYDIKDLRNGDMVALFELKKLRTLSLGQAGTVPLSGITNGFLCRLGEISTLAKLELTRFGCDSRVLQSLGCLKNLRSLVLDVCWNSECFAAICENHERLTELHLGNVAELTDADGKKLCRFRELRSLTFYNGQGFTDSTFEGGVGSWAMKSLVIDGCSMTDAGLLSLASHHNRLEELVLVHCEKITGAGITALLQSQPRLKQLSLSAYVGFDKRILFKNLCPRLRHWAVGP